MNLGQKLKVKSENLEVFATAGTIGLHMVSGPLVGFAIGYGLDFWLDTGPWLKLVFLVIGIAAGFLNVYRDTQLLLKKMQKSKVHAHKEENSHDITQNHNEQDN